MIVWTEPEFFQPTKTDELVRRHLTQIFFETFKQQSLTGNVHEHARNVLVGIIHDFYHDRVFDLQDNSVFINELAGALFCAAHHTGVFATDSLDQAQSSARALAGKITDSIDIIDRLRSSPVSS